MNQANRIYPAVAAAAGSRTIYQAYPGMVAGRVRCGGRRIGGSEPVQKKLQAVWHI